MPLSLIWPGIEIKSHLRNYFHKNEQLTTMKSLTKVELEKIIKIYTLTDVRAFKVDVES